MDEKSELTKMPAGLEDLEGLNSLECPEGLRNPADLTG